MDGEFVKATIVESVIGVFGFGEDNELAEKVQQVGQKRGHNVEVNHLENPRKEAEEHYYNPTYQGLIELGVKPHYLTDEVLGSMLKVVENHKDNIRKEVIICGIKW